MDTEEVLPKFTYINTDVGLKFLNNNKKLYLKILNSFLDRYEHLNIDDLNSEELHEVVHAIKGLSATLGMESLNKLSQSDLTDENIILELEVALSLVIKELSLNLKNNRKEF